MVILKTFIVAFRLRKTVHVLCPAIENILLMRTNFVNSNYKTSKTRFEKLNYLALATKAAYQIGLIVSRVKSDAIKCTFKSAYTEIAKLVLVLKF